MDSFEFNKIAGAVLGTALAVFGLKELTGIVYRTQKPAKQGYAIEVATNTTAGGGQTTVGGDTGGGEQELPLPQLLAKADPAKGEASHKKCQACHDFTKGGPNKTGPNLWDVVGRPIASHEGFTYSAGLKAHSGENWTYENIFKFIHGPNEFAPGSKMTFNLKSATERANVLAYLRTLSDNPKPIPAP